jgi:hypothetical protein
LSLVEIRCIVEGEGDVRATPELVRRIAFEVDPGITIHTPRPFRVSRSAIIKAGELERVVVRATLAVARPTGILILLDSDEDCPAQLGPDLLARARAAARRLPVTVILAKIEFEAWFLAAAESLAGKRDLPPRLPAPADPEAIRDAKGWLSRQMPRRRIYRETLDQPAFASLFDLQAARRADSFDKCYREVAGLIGALRPRP